MQVQSEKINDILKVDLEGRLVASCAESFKQSVYSLLGDSKKVCFDLSKMDYIDSSGIGALIHVLQKINEGGGEVTLACLQPKPKIVFDITKVYRIFDIHDTVDSAIKALG